MPQIYTKDVSVPSTWRYFIQSDLIFPQGKWVGGVNTLLRTKTGVSNRAWKDTIKRQGNATSELTGIFTSRRSQRSSAEIAYLFPLGVAASYSLKHERMHGDIAESQCAPITDSFLSLPTALNRALAKAYKAIREAQVAFSGPIALGEALETMHMLLRPAASIQDLCKKYLERVARDMKRSKGKRPRRVKRKYPPDEDSYVKDLMKAASGAWLENSFGWQPAINDAKDAAKAWNRLLDEENSVPFSGYGEDEKLIRSSSVSQGFGGAYLYQMVHTFDTGSKLVKIRGHVKREATTGGRAQAELFGFTPSEFLPAAWELLPWSFLIDYFTNIGDIINAGVTSTSNVQWTSMSTVDTITRRVHTGPDLEGTRKIVNATKPQLQYLTGSQGLCVHTRRQVNRVKTFPLSIPDVEFNAFISLGQAANIAALLGQANSLFPQRSRGFNRTPLLTLKRK